MSNPASIGFQTGRRWMMIVAMLAIGAMLLAACGGDDDDDDEEPTAPPATEEAADEESPTAAAGDEATPGASPIASPVASPGASPVASPVGSPVAPVGGDGVDEAATPATSPVASPAASPGASPVASGNTIELVDIAFVPESFSIAAGTDVEVTLTNTGATVHDFTIEDLGIAEVLDPGAETTITINAEAGEYEYVCTQEGHLEAGMVGTLTVQ